MTISADDLNRQEAIIKQTQTRAFIKSATIDMIRTCGTVAAKATEVDSIPAVFVDDIATAKAALQAALAKVG